MKVEDLKQDDLFKLDSRQRKVRKVMDIIELDKHDHIAPIGRKILITYAFKRKKRPERWCICGQMSLLKGTEILLKTQ